MPDVNFLAERNWATDWAAEVIRTGNDAQAKRLAAYLELCEREYTAQIAELQAEIDDLKTAKANAEWSAHASSTI